MSDSKPPWSQFDKTYCLSLEGDVDRQRHASAELCAIGLNGFVFVEGVKANSDAVQNAYAEGGVHAFPPCFRCGQSTCGRDDCNNILIEPQVGCFLSFIKIFKFAIASKLKTFLVVEDDIKFHDYALDLAKAAFDHQALVDLGLFSEQPCLIGLGRGVGPTENLTFNGHFRFIENRRMPQNPCFAFNREFAELALARFHKVAHTADVFIHFELSEDARHYSLEPPLSYELSSSTGAVESKIHPKLIRAENEANSAEVRTAARTAFDRHLKHVRVVPLVILGNPRGGTGFMSRAMREFGWDVGHESLGNDGISSWLFAVNDVDLPFGASGHASNSRFVFAEKTIAVVRTSPRAILSTQIENAKNVQSYAFRRRWIKALFDIDLDDFGTDFDRALAAYVYWYQAVALRKPTAWICLERASEDISLLFESGFLDKRKDPDMLVLSTVVNANKPYLGQNYEYTDDFQECFESADLFLKNKYIELKSALFPAFNRHI